MSKKKYTKIGMIRAAKEAGKNAFATLGDTNSKDAKYQYNVEITVTDGNGNKVFSGKNPLVTIQDPRNNPNKTEEQIARIPKWLLKELFVISDS